jgi:uncharacterized protein YcfL
MKTYLPTCLLVAQRPATLALLTLLALGALGTGCQTSDHAVNTVQPANPAYVRHPIEDQRVIRDKTTAKAVALLQVIQGSTPDGLLRIGAEVQNLRSSAFRFHYRFDWFDAQGFPVGTPATTMVSQQIEAGQILILDSVAPHPGARDFRLTLQESTRDFFPILRKN